MSSRVGGPIGYRRVEEPALPADRADPAIVEQSGDVASQAIREANGGVGRRRGGRFRRGDYPVAPAAGAASPDSPGPASGTHTAGRRDCAGCAPGAAGARPRFPVGASAEAAVVHPAACCGSRASVAASGSPPPGRYAAGSRADPQSESCRVAGKRGPGRPDAGRLAAGYSLAGSARPARRPASSRRGFVGTIAAIASPRAVGGGVAGPDQ